jgi:hypothetical protein
MAGRKEEGSGRSGQQESKTSRRPWGEGQREEEGGWEEEGAGEWEGGGRQEVWAAILQAVLGP